MLLVIIISTHAPLARRDRAYALIWNEWFNFYSRASREARLRLAFQIQRIYISTHAPLARRDIGFVPKCVLFLKFLLTRLSRGATLVLMLCLVLLLYFYSRASREARRARQFLYHRAVGFLLTRLSRGATATISSMIAVPHHISLEADFFSHSYHIFMPENRIFGY